MSIVEIKEFVVNKCEKGIFNPVIIWSAMLCNRFVRSSFNREHRELPLYM